MNDASRLGELNPGEHHPAADGAMEYIRAMAVDLPRLAMLQESLASSALSGSRLAQLCSETLRRLLANEPVSDRYLLGLAWLARDMETKPR